MSRSRNSRRGSKHGRDLGPCFCFLCTGRSKPERQLMRAPRDSDHPYGEVERHELHDYDVCMCDECWVGREEHDWLAEWQQSDGVYDWMESHPHEPLRAPMVDFLSPDID